jgi:hypothetical protein
VAFGLDDIIGAGLDIINKFIPDPAQKAQAAYQMAQLQQQTEFKELDAQIAQIQTQTDTNKVEAASTNMFVAGWRPFVGWICGSGLAYQFLFNPLFDWIAAINHWPNAPTLDLSTLITILGGMLGFGAMRTVEKINGVNSGH